MNRYSGEQIFLSLHALSYIPLRGFSAQEVIEAIQESGWSITKKNRFEARKNFTLNSVWNGQFYGTKQVRPIFVVEGRIITVITVYTYYF